MDIRTDRLLAAFRASGLTQTELCNKTGINKGALSSYLSGRYFPKQQAIEKLAAALNVSVFYLMGFDAPSSSSLDQADALFIEKYGKPVYDAAMTFASLDDVDQGKVCERMEMLLEDDKYKGDVLYGEKVI